MTLYKYSLIKDKITNCENCKDYKYESKSRRNPNDADSERHRPH